MCLRLSRATSQLGREALSYAVRGIQRRHYQSQQDNEKKKTNHMTADRAARAELHAQADLLGALLAGGADVCAKDNVCAPTLFTPPALPLTCLVCTAPRGTPPPVAKVS